MLLAMKVREGMGPCCQACQTCPRLQRRRLALQGAQAGSMLCCSITWLSAAPALTKTATGCRDAYAGPGAQEDEARDLQDAGTLDMQGYCLLRLSGLLYAGEADAYEQALRRWRKTCQ